MKKLLIIIVFVAFLTGCEKEQAIDRENLSKAYVEILIAKENLTNDYSKFTIKRDSILTGYNFTNESYKKQLNKLLTTDENWQSFYDSSQAYLERLRDKK